MRVLIVLGLWLGVCEGILVSGRSRSAVNTSAAVNRSAVDSSAVRDNRDTADQIEPQESNERSTFYADHYPGNMYSSFPTNNVYSLWYFKSI